MRSAYDVAVIGAGVVGSAIARELAAYDLTVALIEARDDVGDGTSKANTAILHTGFDATPGTLESVLVARGYHLLKLYAEKTGIPVEVTGALLVAWTPEEMAALPALAAKAERNGYLGCDLVTSEEVYRRVPSLGTGALAGLTVPDEAIICTWTTTLALATDAVARGVDLRLNCTVTGVTPTRDGTALTTSSGEIQAQWVVNAAGLGADHLDRRFGHDRFEVTPRRGELLVFDKLARPLVPCIVLPVPTSRGKGVLVSPTIYGNVMVGPTAEDLSDRADTSTSQDGLSFLIDQGRRLLPALMGEEITTTYAGLRAATQHPDYLIEIDPDQRYLLVGGIRSTGLSASMAIAEHARDLLHGAGLTNTRRGDLPPPPRLPNLGEAGTRPYQDADAIEADADYGRVVCFCERVTRGEVRDAYASPIPPTSLEGLRRRTRVLNGRCQGFFCGAEVTALVQRSGGVR